MNGSLDWNAPTVAPSPAKEEWTDYATCEICSTSGEVPTGTDGTTGFTAEELTTGTSVVSCGTADVPAKQGKGAEPCDGTWGP